MNPFLLGVYRSIGAAVGEGRSITPAAEWLLDNYHLVYERRNLLLTPSIPPEWPSAEIFFRYGSARCLILIEKPDKVSSGVAQVELDGLPMHEGQIELQDDDRQHTVKVTLGQPTQQ